MLATPGGEAARSPPGSSPGRIHTSPPVPPFTATPALRQCDGLPHGTWYKSTHRQHPCTIWTCASRENAAWLVEHGLALAAEYTLRFRKAHKSEDVIRRCGSLLSALPDVAPTTFAQAMPEQYHHHDPVIAYRSYYAGEKMYPAGRPARWTGRDRPAWLPA